MTFIVNNNSDEEEDGDNSDRNNSDQDDEDVDDPRHVLDGMANEDVDEALSRCEQKQG